ncbi:MAG: matrixin family metalloprotease [Bacteroidetes bacterium]|jgi:uncharacterized protein YukE|nr:matrixin family metalloprotease [Bacteroidota bacterium]
MRALVGSLVVLLLFLIYALYPGLMEKSVRQLPCTEPVTYSIGEIDNRFLINPGYLKKILNEASLIWSEAAGRTLFQYAEEGGEIEIELIYGEQQQISDRERQFRSRINAMEQRIVRMEREYNRFSRRFEEKVAAYQRDVQQLDSDISELNRWVQRINRRGGFTELELREYENRKARIDRESRNIEYIETEIDRQGRDLNERIDRLNERIDEKNILVEEYNRSFAGSKRFTQGEYIEERSGRKIRIYHYSDSDELRLVLAHEMGHAMGIEHVTNPMSVMYHLMDGQNRQELKLTPQDIEALESVCGPSSVL